MHLIPRAVAAALLGAVAGAACLLMVAASHPAVTFEMDRALPSYASGFYPLERDGRDTFVWTAEHAQLTLTGLDRRVPWVCDIRFRGARPPTLKCPTCAWRLTACTPAHGEAATSSRTSGWTSRCSPAKPGLVLSLTSSTVYEPGPADPRRLGVQVDRLSCAPASGVILPPHRALGAASLSAAILGCAASR